MKPDLSQKKRKNRNNLVVFFSRFLEPMPIEFWSFYIWRGQMNRRCLQNILFIAGLTFIIFLLPAGDVNAQHVPGLSKGQTIYVPAYSHIYIGNKERPFLLTVTLSIRNIDPKHEIKITTVDYYETQGKMLKKNIDRPVVLQPLESLRYVLPEKDKSGGSGANYIVEWQAETLVNPPIVETIMIGTQSQQGISFTSRGKEILKTE
jgi:hypothetical protein